MAEALALTSGYPWDPKIADVVSLSYSTRGATSPYPDDLSLPLGSVSVVVDGLEDPELLYEAGLRGFTDGIESAFRMSVSSVETGPDGLATISASYGAFVDYLNGQYVIPWIHHSGNGAPAGGFFSFPTSPTQTTDVYYSGVTLTTPSYIGGWVGNGLELISALAHSFNLVAYGVDMAPRSSVVTTLENISEWVSEVSSGSPATAVEVAWYETTYGTQVEVYPPEGGADTVITVNAGEVLEVELPTDSWIRSVNQPVAVDWVESDPHYYDGTSGVYSVAGNDNRPITAAQWTAQGGAVSVRVKEDDPKTLVVTVVGAQGTQYAPYQIAMTSGNNYNSLRVTGSAVRQKRNTVTVATGADVDTASSGPAVSVDYPFVQSLDQAYSLAARLAVRYSGIVPSFSGSAEGVLPTQVVEHSYKRFLVTQTEGDETNLVSFQAQHATNMADFEGKWAGKTMADYEAYWSASKTMREFMIQPLRTAA